MKYSLDSCCGGPVINRAPLLIQKNPLTGIEKQAEETKLDEISTEYEQLFTKKPNHS